MIPGSIYPEKWLSKLDKVLIGARKNLTEVEYNCRGLKSVSPFPRIKGKKNVSG